LTICTTTTKAKYPLSVYGGAFTDSFCKRLGIDIPFGPTGYFI